MGGEDELQLRESTRQRGNHVALPFRVQVQVDLVDEHDAGQLIEGHARGGNVDQVPDEVAGPADEGLVPVRESRERRRATLEIEQVLLLLLVVLSAEADVSRQQRAEQLYRLVAAGRLSHPSQPSL